MQETKFRRLTLAELNDVRDQFVKFLAVNGIDVTTWQRIRNDEPGRADALILQFSQTVFAGVIERIEFLVDRKPNDLRTYKTEGDKIYMRGILLDGDTSVDFTKQDLTPQEMFDRLKTEGISPKLYAAERAYLPIGRDQDVFILMERGALIDDGELFRTLASL
ncbi:DUF6495 family protein [Neolewinella antarctica]|uniref:Uncharacterized protein n=1 Tax=Neolewinella antarctica TaxID=442734 RepID=A0ABX0XC71_9BACT|nr:DUF6495 family protein [Neolewinella antarctica]NJC26519.1 hypothetical protein [Neolewinella antarctica]